jgi:hypothetical protein
MSRETDITRSHLSRRSDVALNVKRLRHGHVATRLHDCTDEVNFGSLQRYLRG